MSTRQKREIESDILVIGGGIAGAMAAIKASEGGGKVLLVDKSFFGRSGCSAVASGVFKMYSPEDDMEDWVRKWGGPFVNRRLLIESALLTHELVLMMDRWGVRWIKEGGEISRCPSPGSIKPHNAMMAQGGPQMMMALRNETLRRGVKVINRLMITDLLTSDGRLPTAGTVIGAIGFDCREGTFYTLKSKATVVAAGPYRFPYALPDRGFSVMPRNLSGDGVAIMLRAGAILSKMDLGGGGMIIKDFYCAPGLEMLLGLGGRLLNSRGERFMERYNPQAMELAGRQDLGNAVLREIKEGRDPIYMDLRHFTPDQFRLLWDVIPIIMDTLETAGIDLKKDLIPYSNTIAATSGVNGAGASINEKGETSIPGLYAAGNNCDAAHSTMGQALPGAAVTGWWAGENAAIYAATQKLGRPKEDQIDTLKEKIFGPLQRKEGISFRDLYKKVENLLKEDVGYILKEEGLQRALQKASSLLDSEIPQAFSKDPRDLARVLGMANFIEALEVVLKVLIHRKESRGPIMKEDYPEIDNENWLNYTFVKKKVEEGIDIWDEPIPGGPDFMPVERKRMVHPFFREG